MPYGSSIKSIASIRILMSVVILISKGHKKETQKLQWLSQNLLTQSPMSLHQSLSKFSPTRWAVAWLEIGLADYFQSIYNPFFHRNIWMQNQGTLELLGISISTPFLREAFDKYGIKVHAFKHGKYKSKSMVRVKPSCFSCTLLCFPIFFFATFLFFYQYVVDSPNSFTHRNFDKAHLEATKSLVVSLENNIRSAINESRLGRIGTDAVWNAIHEYGILTADEAHEISFIDAKYPIDPLMDLVAANSGKKNIREDLEAKWGAELNFPAAQEVSVLQYKRMIDRRKSFQKRKEFFQSHFNTMKRQSETLVDFLKGVELSSRATGELVCINRLTYYCKNCPLLIIGF